MVLRTAKDFHNNCDGKPNTISIIQTADGNIFGGYTSIPWQSHGGYKRDDSAFLILLRSTQNYAPRIFKILQQQTHRAVFHRASYLCTFGEGYDLCIKSNCNSNHSSYVSKYSYNVPSNSFLNGRNQKFKVVDIETFIKD